MWFSLLERELERLLEVYLTDLDFADDIVSFASTIGHAQKLLNH